MAEYIERRRLFNALADYWNIPRDWDGGIDKTCEDALAFIEDAPEADVVEVKHGRWENYPSHAFRRCSVCKVEWEKPRFNIRANYCPNCGARMDGE